jgi:tetratricopeptide (TPR) repeat protein
MNPIVTDTLLQVENLFDAQLYQEALDKLTDSLLEEHRAPDLYAWKGLLQRILIGTYEAETMAGRALNLGLDSALLQILYANIAMDHSDRNKAFEHFERAQKLSPQNRYVFLFRGIMYQRFNENYAAIDNFEHAIELKPDFDYAIQLKGVSYYLNRDYKEALETYAQALQFRSSSTLHYNRALCYDALENEETNADQEYNLAMALPINDANVLNGIGLHCMRKEEPDKAVEYFERALEINPHVEFANGNLGDYYFGLANYERAIEYYSKETTQFSEYKNYYSNQLQLAQEKLEDQNRLKGSEASEFDQDEFIRISASIDAVIKEIKEHSKSEATEVVHYTKLSVAEIYVRYIEEKEEFNTIDLARMHFSNAIYMNDPMEGKVFFEYLNELYKGDQIEQAYLNGEKRMENSVYIGSFLPVLKLDHKVPSEDDLVMWRTYGKDEANTEAKGCSIVINSEFFKYDAVGGASSMQQVSGPDLLNVAYVHNDGVQRNLLNDEQGAMQQLFRNLISQLHDLLLLRDKYSKQDRFSIETDNLIFQKLSEISYLFKSSEYQYEHEVRTIKNMPRGSSDIKTKPNLGDHLPRYRFHIESHKPVLPYISKIFLGPKVVSPQQWSLYLDYEIRRTAEKKELASYKINPRGIEILKSSCKFQ